jgi:hypothetical protein
MLRSETSLRFAEFFTTSTSVIKDKVVLRET